MPYQPTTPPTSVIATPRIAGRRSPRSINFSLFRVLPQRISTSRLHQRGPPCGSSPCPRGTFATSSRSSMIAFRRASASGSVGNTRMPLAATVGRTVNQASPECVSTCPVKPNRASASMDRNAFRSFSIRSVTWSNPQQPAARAERAQQCDATSRQLPRLRGFHHNQSVVRGDALRQGRWAMLQASGRCC